MEKAGTGLTMSLDGLIAGPNDGPGQPLSEGGRGRRQYRAAVHQSPVARRDTRVPGARPSRRGVRLFDHLGRRADKAREYEGSGVTHLTFRVMKED